GRDRQPADRGDHEGRAGGLHRGVGRICGHRAGRKTVASYRKGVGAAPDPRAAGRCRGRGEARAGAEPGEAVMDTLTRHHMLLMAGVEVRSAFDDDPYELEEVS